MSVAEITTQALQLSEEERTELAANLFNSLQLPDPNDGGQDSLSEAIIRSEELDSGKEREVPEEEFWSMVQADRQK
mgnify:CR=1 FL=1